MKRRAFPAGYESITSPSLSRHKQRAGWRLERTAPGKRRLNGVVGRRGAILGDVCGRLSMLEATNAGFATDHAAAAAIFNRLLQARTESGEEIERCDESRLRHLLACRLAWYG